MRVLFVCFFYFFFLFSTAVTRLGFLSFSYHQFSIVFAFNIFCLAFSFGFNINNEYVTVYFVLIALLFPQHSLLLLGRIAGLSPLSKYYTSRILTLHHHASIPCAFSVRLSRTLRPFWFHVHPFWLGIYNCCLLRFPLTLKSRDKTAAPVTFTLTGRPTHSAGQPLIGKLENFPRALCFPSVGRSCFFFFGLLFPTRAYQL